MKRTLVAAATLTLATACSGSSAGPTQPAVSSFADGTCRTAAPDVLAIGAQVRKLGTGKTPPAAPLDAMTSAQNRLDAIATGAEPAYQPALRRLVTAVGLLRLRAHTGSYEPSLGQGVVSAYDDVVKVCTTRQ